MFFFNNTNSFYEEVQKIDIQEIINYIYNIDLNLYLNYLSSNQYVLLCQIFILIFMYRCLLSDKKFLKLVENDIKNISTKLEYENFKIKSVLDSVIDFYKKIKNIKKNITNIKKDIECFEESIENYEFNFDVFEKKLNKLERMIKDFEKKNNILKVSPCYKQEYLEIDNSEDER